MYMIISLQLLVQLHVYIEVYSVAVYLVRRQEIDRLNALTMFN